MLKRSLLLALVVAFVGPSAAFVPKAPTLVATRQVRLSGWLDKAFANEDIATPDRTASGLSGGTPKPSVDIIVCGKKVKGIPGQQMRVVVQAARAPIKFDCGNGQCRTCTSLVNGKKVPLCKSAVPKKGPVKIEKIR